MGNAPGVGTNPPVGTTPGGSSTTGMGSGLGPGTGTNLNNGITRPGVPNTSTPGTFGTGASPSGLPGGDPAHPGFRGKVGR
jgi:hypothetical protein